ncbi:ABC transporter ATP-binding protein [Photobacterium sp. TY1-4]|uniref:ABC transporter ATP-binding protein n=1 Tax=Photobacterium sp. TY1-4 TaxID=2899122 RepID=UPI0021BEFE98|nr:ABC transporter ATP-binding protein [Photobacterium sp. TY1-4]UXI00906.1 ABC transporter ATP-binding protein/permease [Photobacterium sp. TY1-4]
MLKRAEWAELTQLFALMKKHRVGYVAGLLGHAITETIIMISLAFIMRDMINAIIAQDMDSLRQSSFAVIGMGIFTGLTFIIFGKLFFHGLFKNLADIRLQLFDHLSAGRLGDIERYHPGELLSRVNSDVDAVSEVFGYQFRQLIFTLLTGFCAVVAMMLIDWMVGIVLVTVAILTALANRYYAGKMRVVSDRIQSTLGRMSAAAMDAVYGAKEVRIYQMQSAQHVRYEEGNGQWLSDTKANSRLRARLELANFNLKILNFSGMLVLGAVLMAMGVTPLGEIVAMIQLLTALNMTFRELGGLVAYLQKSLAGAKRIFELFALPGEEVEQQQTNRPAAQQPAQPPETACPDLIQPLIDIRGLSFAYPTGKPVLRELSFSVQAGETIAIVGPSGSGKSTLMKLLLRLYQPSAGTVAIAGQTRETLDTDRWRRYFSYIPQDSFLFSNSIKTNLAYGRPDCSMADIEQAARSAGCAPFISTLPQGYDTQLSEGGGNVSGGQKQRLAIARALVKDAEILIMDEPTASLDARTEAEIQAELDVLLRHKTAIVIAHRLKTIRRADRILVLVDGCLVEQGSHETLMQQQGAYFDLVMQSEQEEVTVA